MPAVSPRSRALASWPSSVVMAERSWATVPSARASASGLERRHWVSSASLTASSTLPQPRLQLLTRLAWHRARLLPALLDGPQRGPRGAHVGDRKQRLRLGDQAAPSRGVGPQLALLGGEYLGRAAKNVSWASRNRFHSSASASRPARPASFHWRIRSRYALVWVPQSVESDSVSASTTSFSLRTLTDSRSASSDAK